MCCAALLLDTVLALLHDSISGTPEVLRAAQNAIAVGGAAGFGVSLYLIHIYVTPIKRFLQLLWGTGVLGGLALKFVQEVALSQMGKIASTWTQDPEPPPVTPFAS